MEKSSPQHPPGRANGARETVVFDVHRRLVNGYTIRNMSFSSDIMNAFSGLISSLNTFNADNYACGVPISKLDWHHINRMDKITGKSKLSQRRTGTSQDIQEIQDVCPTWT